MPQIASFAGIGINHDELDGFEFSLDVLYSEQGRLQNSTLVTHTGLSHKRARLEVKLRDFNRWVPWAGLYLNTLTAKTLVIAGNNEGDWMVEGIDTDIDIASTRFNITINLIS